MGKQIQQIWGMALFLTIVCATMIAIMVFFLLRTSILLPLLGSVMITLPAVGQSGPGRLPPDHVVVEFPPSTDKASA